MCEGNGECLSECNCSYLKGTNDCNCYFYEHRHLKSNNSRYCIIDSKCKFRCVLKDCITIEYCGDSYPQAHYQKHNLTSGNQCNYCLIFKVKFPKIKSNCYICSDDKYLIETYCNHYFCLECLMQINSDKDEMDNPCPMCRKQIEFNHF
jgi:DNA-directed RNA polymerase subunit RPC12/RpoP